MSLTAPLRYNSARGLPSPASPLPTATPCELTDCALLKVPLGSLPRVLATPFCHAVATALHCPTTPVESLIPDTAQLDPLTSTMRYVGCADITADIESVLMNAKIVFMLVCPV